MFYSNNYVNNLWNISRFCLIEVTLCLDVYRRLRFFPWITHEFTLKDGSDPNELNRLKVTITLTTTSKLESNQ